MKKLHKPLRKRLIIWVAKGMFKSARKLADALKPETDRKVLIIRSDSPRFHIKESDYILNWGNSKHPNWFNIHYFVNRAGEVSYAINKLKTFQALQDKVNIPEWTTDVNVAEKWWDAGLVFLARHTLTGFGGKGIKLIEPKEYKDFDEAPLYVQYKKKAAEFRAHVFGGKVIDITQKKKRKDFDGEVNTKIRNYANGWVYCREDIEVPQDLAEQALKAVETLGLDFGAVDIIYNKKENKSYVLEVNTAPGLEGTTIEAYKGAILQEINA